ncbi:LytTR family DNA-binding domain-containing protein [Fulvivirga ulvae]|uniref:LytR/AlgR family response regulator transcription factor n=1 Tax=Fulvivirga ulvae TaxID=2904245 RepID=UPI001F1B2321|nr:LytTR family DNA-binding domain-containing protein [Fulvivirga ulvae]UII33183.1 LytTR family DNA-binding domain-containing protein [Fulvivirga ulvae]
MKILIVDDEWGVREALRNMLKAHFSGKLEIEEADNIYKAIEATKIFKPEIILLDIELKDGTGFDFLQQAPPVGFAVIFITAYSEYAIKAFKFNAIDYLLKPVDPIELQQAVEQALKSKPEHQRAQIDALVSHLRKPSKANKYIVLKTAETIYFQDVSEVIRCESSGNYTTFYLQATQMVSKIVVSKPLKEYEELLTPFGFFRIHQSHLINLACMRLFDKREGGYVIMRNGEKIPVSSRRRESLIGILDAL